MVSSLLFDSFHDAPDAWRDVCTPDDLAMDLRALEVFQRTLAAQCRCWGLIVSDAAGTAIGCAALCLFDTELVETNHPAVLRWRDKLRRIMPGAGKMRVLFCGLPVPSGSTHLRVKDESHTHAVLVEIDRVMQELARTQKARLLIFKELSSSHSAISSVLENMRYVGGDIPPMHHMDFTFKNFPEYREALKSRYRAQVQRSQKKRVAAGFNVICGRGAAFSKNTLRRTYTRFIRMCKSVQSRNWS